MRWILLACILAASTSSLAASSGSDREKKLDEQYRQCVQACRKPVLQPETSEQAWTKNIQEESRYDNCVHNCDRMQLRGFKK